MALTEQCGCAMIICVLLAYKYAGMAELADVPDLGSGGLIRAGSNPVTRTKKMGAPNKVRCTHFFV